MSIQAGWIKLHRSITEHWIWNKEKHNYASAWIDLLLMVNHEDRKITINNEVVTIKRGSTWTSYDKLKQRWKWSNDRTRSFIKALISDGMITVNPTRAGTLITVENYSIYQGFSTSDNDESVRLSERKSVNSPVHSPVYAPVTNKKVKNDKGTTKKLREGDGWEK